MDITQVLDLKNA